VGCGRGGGERQPGGAGRARGVCYGEAEGTLFSGRRIIEAQTIAAEKRYIFLSHSSHDAIFAQLLVNEIETILGSDFRVFASTQPNAIPPGSKWRDVIVESLLRAEAFVVLITPASQKSAWLPWEAGFFEAKANNTHIYLLSSIPEIPSPLQQYQSKMVTDESALLAFFDKLNSDLDVTSDRKPKVKMLAEEAKRLGSKPPDRSIEYFFSLVDHAKWSSYGINDKRIYVCQDDMLFQIQIRNWGKYKTLREPWARGFSKVKIRESSVEAMIAGQVVGRYDFVSLMSSVDGRQYFLPVPRSRANWKKKCTEYIWVRNSEEFRLLRVVGSFWNYENFDELVQDMELMVVDTFGDRS
jgi:hypothetical protein